VDGTQNPSAKHHLLLSILTKKFNLLQSRCQRQQITNIEIDICIRNQDLYRIRKLLEIGISVIAQRKRIRNPGCFRCQQKVINMNCCIADDSLAGAKFFNFKSILVSQMNINIIALKKPTVYKQ